jgi:hypothetical protein
MYKESFEAMLTGGHPNSLGQTVVVVEMVLADRARLRTSNALKRISRVKPTWLVPHLERLSRDGRKSVAKTASKTLDSLTP